MKQPNKSKVFAGLSTGVKLEQYARSILNQVHAMEPEKRDEDAWHVRTHSGIEPMLLALAMEFGLKAWFVWDHDTNEPMRTHDLRKLFDALKESSRSRLSQRFDATVDAAQKTWFSTGYAITDVLDHHAHAFVEWRYIHEIREHGMSFDYSLFVPTLELVLDEFGKRYTTKIINEPKVRR